MNRSKTFKWSGLVLLYIAVSPMNSGGSSVALVAGIVSTIILLLLVIAFAGGILFVYKP